MNRFAALCASALLLTSAMTAGGNVRVFPRTFDATVDGSSEMMIKRMPAGGEFLLEVNKGQDVSFYTIQWYKDGVLLEGQTTQRLQFDVATTDMNGIYTVTMTSPCATSTSKPMRVIVGSNPYAINTRIGTTGALNESTLAPFALQDATPNPATDKTTIMFSTTETAPVELKVVDLNGRVVTTLVNETLTAGEHEVMLNAKAFDMAGGLYYIVLTAPGFTQSKPLVLN
jgi:hypothetical protein